LEARTLFLPGASGSASFWKPAALRAGLDGEFFGWPGLGEEPAHPDVNSIGDLVAMVLDHIADPVNIVAQSMGGVVAIMAALAEPAKVNRLVLAVTSGGVPVTDLGGADWRSNYHRTFPQAGRWIADPVSDMSPRIPSIAAPTLLLWGDRDPISPVAVGRRLESLLPNASLHVIAGADHDLAQTHADIVGDLVRRHLL
jgi:pimeloyl-ACP methyl ester carboxylesterase